MGVTVICNWLCNVQGLPFWGWIATLVAAIYYGYGT